MRIAQRHDLARILGDVFRKARMDERPINERLRPVAELKSLLRFVDDEVVEAPKDLRQLIARRLGAAANPRATGREDNKCA
jgi:hypothetical protein